MDTIIRIAAETDLAAIVDIYNQAVALQAATADIAPVSLESRRTWMQEHPSDQYPIFIADNNDTIVGWCSLSAYRPGRMALRHTAEISYYIEENHRGTGIGSRLISHAIDECTGLGIKTLFAIILDMNRDSTKILDKFHFEEWGHMPNVADFDGEECGHLYYGLRITP